MNYQHKQKPLSVQVPCCLSSLRWPIDSMNYQLYVFCIYKLKTFFNPETKENSSWHIFFSPKSLFWRVCTQMWHQRFGVGRHCVMGDSSLIYPQFQINIFQNKNSVIFMWMLARQPWSLQSFWPACWDSCASCWIQQDRCSASLAKAPSETFFWKQSSPCFWEATWLFSYIT